MEVSRVSTYDYITINATMRQMYKKEGCQEKADYIRNRFKKYDDAEDRVISWKKSNGCLAPLNKTVDRIGNVRFTKCTCAFNHPYINKLLQMSDLLNAGILPFEGSLMNQPSQIMEILDVVSDAQKREKNLRKATNG